MAREALDQDSFRHRIQMVSNMYRKDFLNKVCDINAMGECGKQQDRENMEERERKGNGRGQNGGVIEAAERENR